MLQRLSRLYWGGLFIGSLFLFSSCASQRLDHEGPADLQLTTEGFRQLFAPDSIKVYSKRENRFHKWVIEYPFKKTREEQHFVYGIMVAPVGSIKKEDQKGQTLEQSLPDIGVYSRYRFISFGPDGGSFDLHFVSSNRQYDVVIGQSSLLPKGLKEPSITIKKLAKYVDNIVSQKNQHLIK